MLLPVPFAAWHALARIAEMFPSLHASRSANRFEALEPVRQGVHRCFGAIAPGVARGLKLRHDHGSNYMSGDFQDEIECLGIEASPSFRVGRDASPSAAIIVKTTEAGGSSSPHAPSSTQHLSCCSCVGSLVLHDFRDRLLD
jgi:hypothetical protein